MNERGVMYWNMEIDPEEVNRRMECYLCDREEAAFRAFAQSQEIYVIAAARQVGKSRLAEICAELETHVVEPIIEPPKNKPHYRQIGRGNRY